MRRVSTLLAILALSGVPAAAQVCDLVELVTVSAPGSLSAPTILGNTAYVAAGSAGIARFDLHDPSSPAFVAATPTVGQALDLALDFFGSRLVVADGSAGVSTFGIGSDGAPLLTGTVALGGTVISVAGSASQFVAGSQEGTLYTFTVGGGEVIPEGSLVLGGQVRGLALQGSRVYCALGSGGVATVDIANRAQPRLVASLELGGDVLSVAREGSLLFCGVEQVGLASVLVGADSLLLSSSLALPAPPTRMVSWGGRLYMVSPELGVAEADASLGSDVLLLDRLELAGAEGLVLSGNLLYVGRGTAGLAAVDATDCAQSGVLPTTRFIPAAARATGAANTYWVTDVAIANLTGNVATCNLAYLVKNQQNSSPLNVSLVLEAGQQRLVEDLFSSLFGLDAGNGALRITASHPDVKTTSRTYNAAGANGTYGQFIPSLSREQALEPGLVGSLLQLQESPRFRTNIGLVNLTELTVQAEINLYLGDGSLAGVRTETLLPYEMVQLDRIYGSIGAGTVDSGFAVVKALTAGGRILAYASVVDNASGDPIFIPAQTLTPGTPFG